MNKKINLAVAGAALALGATAANAGIVIPAGDWTLDVNGNVNAFMNFNDADAAKGSTLTGNIANGQDGLGESDSQGINTGLLPSWLGFTGTTRQNNTDVSFTISFQPNASDNSGAGDNKTPLNRQSYLSFGDKSWGSIKIGKDIGIFASGAILNDMTLLGVGSGATGKSGGATTLGGIGTGYVYAAWKGQATYTTPNMGGFQAKVGLMNPNQIPDAGNAVTTRTYSTTSTFTGITAAVTGSVSSSIAHISLSVSVVSSGTVASTTTATDTITGAAASSINQDRFGIEAEASYSWTGDVAGKVWVSGASYDVTRALGTSVSTALTKQSYDITAYDVGASISAGNFGLVGYWYDGEGLGTTIFGSNGVTAGGAERDSDGGYVQATYVIPTGTKLGVAYGVSNLDTASGETNATLVEENERWTVGAYHPLTKHLNLVAEYNSTESTGQTSSNSMENDTMSLGAILFF
jgi:predicted porin